MMQSASSVSRTQSHLPIQRMFSNLRVCVYAHRIAEGAREDSLDESVAALIGARRITERLTQFQRDVLLAVFAEGYSVGQVAAQIDCSHYVVRTQLKNALDALAGPE